MKILQISGLAIAAIAASSAAAQEEPAPAAAEEVDRICFARDINGWRAVEGEDNVVLLERGVNDWYRVELAGGCDARLFRFAQSIVLDRRPAGGCITTGDAILVEDTGNFTRRCVVRRMEKTPAREDRAD